MKSKYLFSFRDFNNFAEEDSFFSSTPVASNLLNNDSYAPISQLELSEFSNVPINKIAHYKTAEFVKSIANYTFVLLARVDYSQNYIPVGTAVLISKNEAIVARHCIEDRPRNTIKLGVFSEKQNSIGFVDILSRHNDPDGLDISVVTLSYNLGEEYGFAQIELDEQPVGRFVMVHYANGVKQASSGDFATSDQFLNDHNLFLNAGTGASGAGIFNHRGKLVGVNVYRTDEYHRISRKPVLLAHSKLFNQNAFCPLSDESVVKLYPSPFYLQAPRHLLQGFNINQFESPIVKTYSPFEPFFKEPTTNWNPNDYEGIRARATIRQNKYNINQQQLVVNEFRDIDNFLTSLEQVTSVGSSLNKNRIPSSLCLQKRFLEFDTHQPQHMVPTRRKGKSIFFSCIAGNAENPIFIALAICLIKIASEYRKRNRIEKRLNYLIDLGFDIGFLEDGRTKTSQVLLTEDIFRSTNFHFYPADNSVEVDYESINCRDFLEQITPDYQNQIQVQFQPR